MKCIQFVIVNIILIRETITLSKQNVNEDFGAEFDRPGKIINYFK